MFAFESCARRDRFAANGCPVERPARNSITRMFDDVPERSPQFQFFINWVMHPLKCGLHGSANAPSRGGIVLYGRRPMSEPFDGTVLVPN